MQSFNILGLDKDFTIIALLRPFNIQWNRKYFESGDFSIQLPLEQYDKNIKYIYTKDRREVGKVQQVNYVSNDIAKYVSLSGYFLEEELNKGCCRPSSTYGTVDEGTVIGSDWEFAQGKAEDVARQFLYLAMSIDVYYPKPVSGHPFGVRETIPVLTDINVSESQHRGHESCHARHGEQAGDKIYQILKPSGLSYRIDFDFLTATKTYEVWEGLDRTSDNTKGNNPVVFSTKYGNIKNPDIVMSTLDYKNCYIAAYSYTSMIGDRNLNFTTLLCDRLDWNSDEEVCVHYYETGIMEDKIDYKSDDTWMRVQEFHDIVKDEAFGVLNGDYPKLVNVTFDAMESSYTYMEDFDLGDVCSVEIPEMGISADARIIGCYEVIKDGKWEMTLEFGEPILQGGK